MIKRFAPLAMLFGLLTALLLGGTATAQANPILNFQCNNVVGVGVVCDNTIVTAVTVTIKDSPILSNNQLIQVQNVLNNITIDILNPTTYINNVNVAVVNLYKNTFNIPITVGDVTVCLLSVCG